MNTKKRYFILCRAWGSRVCNQWHNFIKHISESLHIIIRGKHTIKPGKTGLTTKYSCWQCGTCIMPRYWLISLLRTLFKYREKTILPLTIFSTSSSSSLFSSIPISSKSRMTSIPRCTSPSSREICSVPTSVMTGFCAW